MYPIKVQKLEDSHSAVTEYPGEIRIITLKPFKMLLLITLAEKFLPEEIRIVVWLVPISCSQYLVHNINNYYGGNCMCYKF